MNACMELVGFSTSNKVKNHCFNRYNHKVHINISKYNHTGTHKADGNIADIYPNRQSFNRYNLNFTMLTILKYNDQMVERFKNKILSNLIVQLYNRNKSYQKCHFKHHWFSWSTFQDSSFSPQESPKLSRFEKFKDYSYLQWHRTLFWSK